MKPILTLTALALLLHCCALSAAPTDSAPGNTRQVASIEYRVVGKQPRSRKYFVQGLEIRNGSLYQGTGMRGQSGIQVFDLESGQMQQSRRLSRKLFGEGITVLGDQVVQLTWRSRRAFVYDRADLSLQSEFRIPGEGWGLTNDGEQLIYSDGSAHLHFIDPSSWRIERSLQVTRNGIPLQYLNELEWTPDYLLANVWREDAIYMIDLDNGEVIGEIDLRGLLPAAQRKPTTDVLNGIAIDPSSGLLWVTGKYWPAIYQIELGSPP